MNPASAKNLASSFLALAIGAGIAGFILLRQSTPRFQSTAAVRVVRDKTDLEQLGDRAPAGLDNAVFLQNEAELIRSDTILQKVVDRLALNQEWGKRYFDGQRLKTVESLAMLKARVFVSPEPGAAPLLRIQTTSDNAGEATKLAEALAAAYCEYRVERRHRIAQDTLAALAVPYQENEAKVRLADELVEKTRLELDASVRDQNPPPPPATEDSATLGELRRRHTQATMLHLAKSNQLALSKNLPAEDVQKLEAQVARAYAELTSAEAALRLEVKKQEALRIYWLARQELDKAKAIFKPYQETMAANQRDLGPLENPPAVIKESASPAVALPAHKAVAEQGCLIGAGVLLLAGAGLFFRSRPPAAKA